MAGPEASGSGVERTLTLSPRSRLFLSLREFYYKPKKNTFDPNCSVILARFFPADEGLL